MEAALPSLSALMVRVECSERFSIRLMMEDAAGLPKTDKYRALGKLTIDDADGALCATLSPFVESLHAGLMCTVLLTGTIAGLFGCMSAVRRHRRFAPLVFALLDFALASCQRCVNGALLTALSRVLHAVAQRQISPISIRKAATNYASCGKTASLATSKWMS